MEVLPLPKGGGVINHREGRGGGLLNFYPCEKGGLGGGGADKF